MVIGSVGVDDDRVPCFAAPLGNPDPNSIRVETWVGAEDVGREVLRCIHPTLDSDEERKDVIDYVQTLIRKKLRLEVFPYGSVPLKTFLPDGDIDLTVISNPNLDGLLPGEVLCVLQEEENNANAVFELRDTQFIDAEVKLVKCVVQDIVIDISFNQLGGLSTLCFLEQVDRLVDKDHLFKRSLILIKAWCYYESRILGAFHGLLSTYALEILVLYIFQFFHASLNGPLEVLYRFLDYYGKFDWDNYCISLDGPVRKSSLPRLAVEMPNNQGTDVLLGADFRKNHMDMFTVPSKGAESDLRTFCLKNLNIIDPLRENNNLGRSVRKGSYFRIRSAFRFGARRLGNILQQPNINTENGIRSFFCNTLQRHTPNYGQGPTLLFSANGFGTLPISPHSESSYEDDVYPMFSNADLDDYMNGHIVPPLKRSELANGDNDSSSDNLSDDEKDANDDSSESDMWNMYQDLTGDYDGHIRNLLYGQGCHGYALSKTMVWANLSPPTSPYGDENMLDRAHSLLNYTNGSNSDVCHDASRGTGLFIPVMRYDTSEDTSEDTQSPTSDRGSDRGSPVSNGSHYNLAWVQFGDTPAVRLNRARESPFELSSNQASPNASLFNQTHQHVPQVNSTANGFAHRTRKLIFGSFRSVTENPSNEQSPEVDASGEEEESSMESSLRLDNEDEFPPLSAA